MTDASSMTDRQPDNDMCGLILHSLEDGVYLVDRDRRITYWNDGAERITGYLAQDVLGRFCANGLLSHCGPTGTLLCAGSCPLADTMADRKPRTVDAFLKHRLGHRVPVNIRSAPVRNEAKEIIGAVEIFHVDVRHYGQALKFRGLERFGCLDAETGAANRDMTLLRIQHRLQDLRTFGIPLGLISIELTERESVISRYGQEAWMGLLRATAQTIAWTMPPSGFLGRWEPVRFLALLGNCDPITLEEISRRLINLIHATEIPWWGDFLRPSVVVRTSMAEPEATPRGAVARLIS